MMLLSNRSHSLAELPTEILYSIFEHFDDIIDYVSVASTCKRFEEVVRLLVASSGDSPTQASTFERITGEYIPLDLHNDIGRLEKAASLRKYKHVVFEFSLYQDIHLLPYIEYLGSVRSSKHSTITELILSPKATRNSVVMSNIIEELRQNPDHYLFNVKRTIFVNNSDHGLLIPRSFAEYMQTYLSIMVIARTYSLCSIKSLPWISVVDNPRHELIVHGPKLNSLGGCYNFGQAPIETEVETTQSFFQKSSFPNVQHIEGFSVLREIDLNMFQSYSNLESLILTFHKAHTREFIPNKNVVYLPQLKKFKVIGGFIVLYNMDLPNLHTLEIESHGASTALEGQFSDVVVGNLHLPNLKDLSLKIPPSCPTTIGSVLKGMRDNISVVEQLTVVGNLKTVDFDQIRMTNVNSIVFKGGFYNNIEAGFHTLPEIIDSARNLRYAEVSNLYNFQNLIFFSEAKFLYLNTLVFNLDFRHSNLRFLYLLENTRFPVLEDLRLTVNEVLSESDFDMKTSLKITLNLPTLKRLHASSVLLDYCISWLSDSENVEITTS